MKRNVIFISALFLFCCTISLAQSDVSLEERNERIRQRWNRSLVNDPNYTFNKEANNLLQQTARSVKPGKALCVAMGQGRNALYLARNGWEVSGFDLADEALAHAQKQAKEENLDLNTEIASYDSYDFGTDKWDMITWLYGGCLEVDQIVGKIRNALKPGGLFVFEFFHRDAGIQMGRPQFGCEENAVRNKFTQEGGFDILLYEEKVGTADYSLDQYKLIYMVVSRQ